MRSSTNSLTHLVILCLGLCVTGMIGCKDASPGNATTSDDQAQTVDGVVSPTGVSLADCPLPDDPFLTEWTQRVEEVYEAALELQGLVRGDQDITAARDARVLSLWEQIATILPDEDLLRQSLASGVSEYFAARDVLKAAQIAEHSRQPGRSDSLYRSLDRLDDARRIRAKADRYSVEGNQLSEQSNLRHQAKQKDNDWLARLEPTERLMLLTTGPGRSAISGVAGFSAFVATLPDNARLRRALTIYYVPMRMCGLSSLDGELDVSEPILRLTAEAFPDRLGETYRLIVAAGYGQRGWFTGPGRIPGDFSPTGNALVLTRDLLRLVPEAKAEILAVARSQMDQRTTARRRCRWSALVAYLQDGTPDPGDDPKAMLLAKLAGDVQQRRWAMAWLPNQLAEAAPDPYPFVTDAELAAAVVAAAKECQTPDDRYLAMDALRILPPTAGLALICQATGSEDEALSKAAITAILTQHRRVQRRPSDDEERSAIAPNAELLQVLPALREAFYPHLALIDMRLGNDLIHMFADLRDPQLDAQLANYLRTEDLANNRSMSFLGDVALTAHWYSHMDWDKTITAIEELTESPEPRLARYAASLARNLRNRTW